MSRGELGRGWGLAQPGRQEVPGGFGGSLSGPWAEPSSRCLQPSAVCPLLWHLGERRVEFAQGWQWGMGDRFHRIVELYNLLGWKGPTSPACGSSSPAPGMLAVGASPASLGAAFLLQVRRLLPGCRQLPGPAVGSRGGSGSAGAPGAAQHHPGTAELSPWLSSGVPVLGDPSSFCVPAPRAAPRIGSWPTSAASSRVWMPAGISRCAQIWGGSRDVTVVSPRGVEQPKKD